MRARTHRRATIYLGSVQQFSDMWSIAFTDCVCGVFHFHQSQRQVLSIFLTTWFSMGDSPTTSETSITFGCTEDLKTETRIEAAKQGESMSEFIRNAIRDKLETNAE